MLHMHMFASCQAGHASQRHATVHLQELDLEAASGNSSLRRGSQGSHQQPQPQPKWHRQDPVSAAVSALHLDIRHIKLHARCRPLPDSLQVPRGPLQIQNLANAWQRQVLKALHLTNDAGSSSVRFSHAPRSDCLCLLPEHCPPVETLDHCTATCVHLFMAVCTYA